jgi:hypothetical protein
MAGHLGVCAITGIVMARLKLGTLDGGPSVFFGNRREYVEQHPVIASSDGQKQWAMKIPTVVSVLQWGFSS